MVKREVCCGSMVQVRRAVESGADRIELCSALEVGGVTPSPGMIRQAVALGTPVQVLIRLRSGDFCYTSDEVEAMCDDIRLAGQLGAHGVVIGALTSEGDIDQEAILRMVEAAQGLSVTFHRAFDECREPLRALEQIISLGCDRILTSGQAPTAPEGVGLLRQLVQQAGDRIIILAGSGVTPDNAERLVEDTGVREIHGTRLSDLR